MTAIVGIVALALFVAVMLVLPRLSIVRRLAGVETNEVPRRVFTDNCRDWLLRPTAVRGESSVMSSEERLRPVSIIRTDSREVAEVLRRHSSGRVTIRVIGPEPSRRSRLADLLFGMRWRRRAARAEVVTDGNRLGNAIAAADTELTSHLALAEIEAS